MSEPIAEPSRTDWARVALALLAGASCNIQLGVMAPMVPLLQRELGLTLPFVGAILSAVTAVATVLGAMGGTLAARLGLARSLKLGLLILALTAAAGAVIGDGSTLLGTRCIAGIGYIFTMVSIPPLIARLAHSRDRSFVLGIWSALGPLGIACAEGAAQLLGPLGWRGLFWLDAVLLAAVCAGVAVGVSDRGYSKLSPAGGIAFWHLYGMRRPMLLTGSFICFAFAFMVFAGLVPTYLNEVRGVALAKAGRLVGLAMLAGIFGAIGAGWLMRRGWSPFALAVASMILPALLSIAVFMPTPLPLTIAALAGASLLGTMMPAATYALIPRVAPDPHLFAPINGLLTQFGSLGVLIGPPVFAAWTDAVGWSSGPVLLIALAVAGMACLTGIGRNAIFAPR